MSQVRCFIAYSYTYRSAMELLRKWLEVLDFTVDVFDYPDMENAPPNVVQEKILQADCVVALLGPASSEPDDHNPAVWPTQEAVHAHAQGKPLALVIHPGIPIPPILSNLQTPSRFNFFSSESLIQESHNILRQLIELKRLVQLPSGSQPFFYKRVLLRSRIERNGTITKQSYHEVIARQLCTSFHHAVGSGLDKSDSGRFELLSSDSFEAEVTLGGSQFTASIRVDEVGEHEINYYVDISPPLREGSQIGYRRTFYAKNTFPLSGAELSQRSLEEGFPSAMVVDGRPFYGMDYSILFDIEEIRFELEIPRSTRLRSRRVIVLSYVTKALNPLETERCNGPEFLSIEEKAEDSHRKLVLLIPRPLMNHTYLLLYDPI